MGFDVIPHFGQMLHPDFDDRRGQVLSPMEEAQLIMGQAQPPSQRAPIDEVPPINALGTQAGMLDINRAFGLAKLRRMMQEQMAAQPRRP